MYAIIGGAALLLIVSGVIILCCVLRKKGENKEEPKINEASPSKQNIQLVENNPFGQPNAVE